MVRKSLSYTLLHSDGFYSKKHKDGGGGGLKKIKKKKGKKERIRSSQNGKPYLDLNKKLAFL